MSISGHDLHTLPEDFEVVSLRCPERILREERNDRLQQVVSSPDNVLTEVFTVIIVTPVDVDSACAEELQQLLEAVSTPLTLRNDESVEHLEASPVALSPRAAWLPHVADGEAPFPVYKAGHPATELDQSFLLIFRTHHVVTMISVGSDGTMSSVGFTGFPAYSQMRTAPLPTRGAASW
jgi:hypothetical protein